MNLDLIVGTRPNFVKVAPLIRAIETAQNQREKINFRLIHTGQHFSDVMSEIFFEELNLPQPDYFFDTHIASISEQFASIMQSYNRVLKNSKPDFCVVFGDVTSTLAVALTAKQNGVKVAHVEAGLRSFDETMPEEVNRKQTDHLSDICFTSLELANQNLRNEGINSEKIVFVGNIMADTFLQNKGRFYAPEIWNREHLEEQKYILLTLHRPENVDDSQKLQILLENIAQATPNLPIIFPLHHRTKKQINFSLPDNILCCEVFSYLQMGFMLSKCQFIITDSGGLCEEATLAQVPCFTFRKNTERPETIILGTNRLVDIQALKTCVDVKFDFSTNQIPFWEGQTAQRIISHFLICKV